jgi:5-methylcytosine-specific restriction endonuclease McrA
MGTAPAFASASEALAVARAALGYLASADATGMADEEQAGCLRGLERVTSVVAAARSSVLGAFTAGKGYAGDADYSPRAWLIHKTGITRGAAVSYTAWAKRAVAHPEVFAVLAAGDVSESFARTVCTWTDKLPFESRDKADAILMAAAGSGLGLRDLAVLASEMLARCWQPDRPDPAPDPGQNPGGQPGDDRPDEAQGVRPGVDGEDSPGEKSPPAESQHPDDARDEVFEDRALRLLVTFGGAGVLHGELTPECAEIVNTVLDALAVPAGPEDDRDQGQRYHDALQEAMTRLIASGLLPERAGQPVKAWVNISLADLMLLDGSSALVAEWTAGLRARFAAHRAASAGGGGDNGGAWLDGDAAEGIACDAMLAPVVTGDVDPGVFGDLVRLCVELDELSHGTRDGHADAADGGDGGESRGGMAWPGTGRSRQALEQAIVGKAAALLSGPGGLASFLRRRQLGARLAGPSLPLDIGYASTVPASIRRAVRLRDRHCQWAGGCDQPASACDVHHTTHKADGGKTSLKDCVLLCRFHHLIAIHRWGWTLAVNPDGTTTAWNKDKTKILHSHSPPARAG